MSMALSLAEVFAGAAGSKKKLLLYFYHDKIYQCMRSTQELIGIHKDSAYEELVEIYNRRTKVGKVN